MKKVLDFYLNGFRNLPGWARSIWFIVLIKLFIMFFILKIFFFPNFLKSKHDNDKERADYVIEQITTQ